MDGADAAVVLVEKVFIDRAALRGKQTAPIIVAVIEPRGRVQLVEGTLRLAAGVEKIGVFGVAFRGREQRRGFLRMVAEYRPQLFKVVLPRDLRRGNEYVRFVHIVAGEQRLLVVFTLFIGEIRLLGDGIAVHGHCGVRIPGRNELLGGDAAQLVDAVCAEFLHDRAARFERGAVAAEGVVGLLACDAARFGDRVTEQALGKRGNAQRVHTARACGLARDRDLFGVSAEGGDVVPHPFERKDLVQQAVVAGAAVRVLRSEIRVRIIAKHAEAVRDADEHHALPSEGLAAVVAVVGAARSERAAVDIDEHGAVRNVARGLPYVQIQRILAHRLKPVVLRCDLVIIIDNDMRYRIEKDVRPRLHAHRRKGIARADAAPGLRLFGSLPAQLADWRLGVRDAGIDLHAAVLREHTGQITALSAAYRRHARLFRAYSGRLPFGRS